MYRSNKAYAREEDKLLIINDLFVAEQKCLFWLAKEPVSACDTACFARQNNTSCFLISSWLSAFPVGEWRHAGVFLEEFAEERLVGEVHIAGYLLYALARIS